MSTTPAQVIKDSSMLLQKSMIDGELRRAHQHTGDRQKNLGNLCAGQPERTCDVL